MTPRMKKIVFTCLLAMVVAIGFAHYLTPGHLILFHDTFRRLSYFPIVIGAIIYGVWGGLSMAVLSCLSFVPHLLMFWYQGPETYYSELSEILFYLAAGLVIGMISSRENRLRAKYQSLSEQLAASYKRLHSQAARLVQAEKELGEAGKLSLLGHVSASLAHEIKNPLAAIKGAAEILADEVDSSHPKHEFVDIMRSEITRLDNSVEEVLSYCRGQQVTAVDKTVPLDRVADQVFQVVAPRAREKSAGISREQGDASPHVPSAAMTQVLMNLMINAVDAVPVNGTVRLSWEIQGDGTVIRVEDNGPGLDPDRHEAVFKSFVTFKQGGTGLGLSIAQKIVKRLGGEISVGRSTLGGACFTVCLPDNTRKNEKEKLT